MSGCTDILDLDNGSVTYVSHPTKVSYTIVYGYDITCEGQGTYTIKYDCDKPDTPFIGTITSQILYPNYDEVTLASNEMISWNIDGKNTNSYSLGVTANVMAESYLVSDLNGANALTIQEINSLYHGLVNQYCRTQSVNDTIYIDPDNALIESIAQDVKNEINTNNSFLVAKELFIWLKENTVYQKHIGRSLPQPALLTCSLESGDCDDLSYLYISLCRSLGIPARFIRGYVVEGVNSLEVAVSHAWAEVFVGGSIGNNGWVPVECAGTADDSITEVNQNFGVESITHLRLFTDDGTDEAINVSISGPQVQYETSISVDMTSVIELEDHAVLESKELYIDGEGNRRYLS